MALQRPVALIQARMGSTRLPGKVLAPLAGRPLLAHVVARVKATEILAEVVVATTDASGDAPIRDWCAESGVAFFAGSEDDVLDRFHGAALAYGADPIVRITSDCPFVDPIVLGQLIELYERDCYDYAAVATGAPALFLDGRRFPLGLDAECVSFAALDQAWREAQSPQDREHVTPFVWGQPERFRIGHLEADADLYHIRLTVDTPRDLELAQALYDALYRDDAPVFGLADVLAELARRPELRELNAGESFRARYREAWQERAPRKP